VVLDAKAMEWANEHGIDTAKLRAAKVPIYGKWYFPDIPANVPMINLKTGEIQSFSGGLRAGEILYVTRPDLRRARLGPYASLAEAPAPVGASAAPSALAAASEVAADATSRVEEVEAAVPGEPLDFHMPGPSIYPLVLALGLSIALLGLVAGPIELRVIVILLGVVYLLAGALGWVVQNHREGLAIEAGGEHGGTPGLH
jgi:hypothetical protein